MSTSAPNKHPRTSVTGWSTSPGGPGALRRRREEELESPSTSSSARKVVTALRPTYVNGSESDLQDARARYTSDHYEANAQAMAMVIDSTSHGSASHQTDTIARQRMIEGELAAIRRMGKTRDDIHLAAAADSQRIAKMEQVRAKAAVITDPFIGVAPNGPRSHVGRQYRELEYTEQISSYMVEMDVSNLSPSIPFIRFVADSCLSE